MHQLASALGISLLFSSFVWCNPDQNEKDDKTAKKSIEVRQIEKQVYDSLREIHNKGADLYNQGDSLGCYRLFQGTLLLTRSVLPHRPEEQKRIDEGLADAEKEPLVSRKAFLLHELIEKVYKNLREEPKEEPKGKPEEKKPEDKKPEDKKPNEKQPEVPKQEGKKPEEKKTETPSNPKSPMNPDPKLGPMKETPKAKTSELIPIIPREVLQPKKIVTPPNPKGNDPVAPKKIIDMPKPKISETSEPTLKSKEPINEPTPKIVVAPVMKSGVGGNVIYKGKPLPNVEIIFVTRGWLPHSIDETESDATGIFRMPTLAPGKYSVLICPGKNCPIKDLPVRYRETTSTPLIIDIKPGGEKLDFILE